MANPILWPINILSPREFMMDIAPRTLAGPSSVSGVSQVAASDAGIWKASYSGIPVVNCQSITLWRALNTMFEGRMNSLLLPYSTRCQPFAPDWASVYDGVPHSDGSPFADSALYRSRLIDIGLISNIPLRGTTANIQLRTAYNVQPGQVFSVDGRLYRIRTLQRTGENTVSITFRPPAREVVPAGSELEFDEPVCRMRLASDNEMDLPLDYGRWSFPTVSFIEDV